MPFIFFLFIFSDLIKAETISSYSFSEVNKLEVISQKELSKSYFLKEIPRTNVSSKEKNSLKNRNPFLPFGQNIGMENQDLNSQK